MALWNLKKDGAHVLGEQKKYFRLTKHQKIAFCSIDLFHLRSQPLFHREGLEESLVLAFEIESITMICSLKLISGLQFVKNFHLGVQYSVLYDDMRSQPQFHAAM